MGKVAAMHNDSWSIRLRRDAEYVVRAAAAGANASPQAEVEDCESEALVGELRLARVALELQNQELRSAVAELTNAKHRLATLFEEAPVVYLTISPSGWVQQMNRAARAVFCNTVRHVPYPAYRLVSAADRSRFERHLARVRESNGHHSTHIWLQRPDGALFPARVESDYRGCSDGNVRSAVFDLTDFWSTDWRCAELEELHSLTGQIAYSGIWSWTPQPDVVTVNKRTASDLGWTDEPPLWSRADWLNRVHPLDLDGTVNALAPMVIPNADRLMHRLRVQSADGGYVSVIIQAVGKWGPDDSLERLVGTIMRD
ncbi:MAG: PAS domain-containing protein [Myxococcota bacterium]|jgi:PAS domain-containing protein